MDFPFAFFTDLQDISSQSDGLRAIQIGLFLDKINKGVPKSAGKWVIFLPVNNKFILPLPFR